MLPDAPSRRFADMVIIGQNAPHGLPDGWRPEHLLSACGVPLMVVPTGWQSKIAAGRIIIGWLWGQ